MLEFSIVSLSAFVGALNELTKAVSKSVFKKEINRFIPIFSIIYGILLSIIGYRSQVSYFGTNIIEAIFIGLSSGAAATGYHQVGKQLMKTEEQESFDETEEDK